MYIWKQRFRGYNQCEILAKHIGKALDIPVAYDLIRKTSSTQAQAGLSQSQRHTNITQAFQIHRQDIQHIPGKRIIIIDDVISTGATLQAIARLLKAHGASEVI